MKSIQDSNSMILNTNPKDTWTTRENLYLISSVLLNGDQNWTEISEQLQKLSIILDKNTDNQPVELLVDATKEKPTANICNQSNFTKNV